jgi:hypothetical protein
MNFSSHVPPDKASGGAKLPYLKGIGTCSADVRFSNRPFRVKRFRLSTTTVLMSLAGSCFSSESAPGPSIMGSSAIHSSPADYPISQVIVFSNFGSGRQVLRDHPCRSTQMRALSRLTW